MELTDDDKSFAARLQLKRPTPTPTFRGALARRVASIDPGYGHRPAKLWLHVAAFAAAGTLLIIAGAILALGAR